jgi:hypothetical protein
MWQALRKNSRSHPAYAALAMAATKNEMRIIILAWQRFFQQEYQAESASSIAAALRVFRRNRTIGVCA